MTRVVTMRDRVFLFLLFSLISLGNPWESTLLKRLGMDQTPVAIAQTPTPTPQSTPQIRPGTEGEIVRQLQQRLQKKGYFSGEINGIYDQVTEDAVSEFQRSQGLAVTGIFDLQAWERLKTLPDIPSPENEQPPAEKPHNRRALAIILLGGLTTFLAIITGLFLILKFLSQRHQLSQLAVAESGAFPPIQDPPKLPHSDPSFHPFVTSTNPVTQLQSDPNLLQILEAVSAGYISPTVAQEKLRQLSYQAVDSFAKIDTQRQGRTGFPEVIWGQDKTPDQLVQIMERMRDRQSVIMATRITPTVYSQIKARIPDLTYYETARICALGHATPHSDLLGKITILTAGTSDLPVAEEAAITAELFGFPVERLWDVGVSGIQRLLSNRQILDQADVLIVVAGMEGALPSVVGGLANCPVIGVPTSVGYGANFGGVAPLLSMLNSCAAGIGVVNIDNGFGAAILAGQILRTASKLARNRDHSSSSSVAP